MRKAILLTTLLFLVLGCETGVKNQIHTIKEVPSGIVDRDNSTRTYSSSTSSYKTAQSNSKKIFSKSAQPGYYLQFAVFQKNKPSQSFLQPLNDSPFGYIVLTHYNKHHVLIGPYKSYNEAKTNISDIQSNLHKKAFVVQVLRP